MIFVRSSALYIQAMKNELRNLHNGIHGLKGSVILQLSMISIPYGRMKSFEIFSSVVKDFRRDHRKFSHQRVFPKKHRFVSRHAKISRLDDIYAFFVGKSLFPFLDFIMIFFLFGSLFLSSDLQWFCIIIMVHVNVGRFD